MSHNYSPHRAAALIWPTMPDSFLSRERDNVFATNQEAFEFLYGRWGLPAVQVMISAVKAYGADTGAVQVLTLMPAEEMSFTHQDEKALVGGMRYIEDNLPLWQETRVLTLPDGQKLTLDAALVADD